MARSSHRQILVQTLFLKSFSCWIVIGSLAGCNAEVARPKAVRSAPPITATVADPTPGVVEIISVTAKRRPENIIFFEVAYKFTSGSPIKNYMLNLGFPGTSVAGHKPMDAWEVKPEGMIKTGMPVPDPAAKDYEVTFAEADSPDRGYTTISNKFTGEIDPAEEPISK